MDDNKPQWPAPDVMRLECPFCGPTACTKFSEGHFFIGTPEPGVVLGFGADNQEIRDVRCDTCEAEWHVWITREGFVTSDENPALAPLRYTALIDGLWIDE